MVGCKKQNFFPKTNILKENQRDIPMTSKIVDWKIQTDLTHVKPIQYDAVGGLLDCFYTIQEAWIINPPFLEPLD